MRISAKPIAWKSPVPLCRYPTCALTGRNRSLSFVGNLIVVRYVMIFGLKFNYVVVSFRDAFQVSALNLK